MRVIHKESIELPKETSEKVMYKMCTIYVPKKLMYLPSNNYFDNCSFRGNPIMVSHCYKVTLDNLKNCSFPSDSVFYWSNNDYPICEAPLLEKVYKHYSSMTHILLDDCDPFDSLYKDKSNKVIYWKTTISRQPKVSKAIILHEDLLEKFKTDNPLGLTYAQANQYPHPWGFGMRRRCVLTLPLTAKLPIINFWNGYFNTKK